MRTSPSVVHKVNDYSCLRLYPRAHRSCARAQRRRSKGIVGLALPLFFVLQAALGWRMECAKPEQVDAAFGARLKLLRRQIALRPGDPLVLMLGSSRTMTGFRPDMLKDRPYVAFNFGREGSGPVKNLIHVRRLLEEGIRPDLLVVDITVPGLAIRGDVPAETQWVDGALLQRGERRLLEKYHDRSWRVLGQWFLARAFPSFACNRTLSACLSLHRLTGFNWFENVPGMDEWGYAPMFFFVTPEQRGPLTKLALDQYAFLGDEDHVSPAACRAVRDLIDLCQAKHIPLVLVAMPEGTSFHALYRPQFMAEVNQFLAGVAATGTPLIDARKWLADDEFFDQHHQLPTGGLRFTHRLEEAIRHLLPG